MRLISWTLRSGSEHVHMETLDKYDQFFTDMLT
jgi:hypothetical protein